MGKQPKTGIYQYNAFGEMQAIKELRHEEKLLQQQILMYDRQWSDEKRAEVAQRMADIRETITLLGG